MKGKIKLLWTIFFTFLKISPVTFGGGYAMLSLIENEVVKKHNWIEEKELSDIFAISQSIPGAVAINSAIFVGHRVANLKGSLAALTGITFPTLIIVVGVSHAYSYIQDNRIVNAALLGIGASVIALILHAAYTVGRTAIHDRTTLIIGILSLAGLLFFQFNPIWVIVGGFIAGISICKLKVFKKERFSHSS